MRIFISWSGTKAKAAALLLRDWLPSVIQLLDVPWVSDVDIESGANWSATIGANLSEARYGIVCVTQENQNRPWLNFEAGAISQLVGGCTPLLIDFDSKGDLSGGPMSQLQIRMPDREDIGKLMHDVNRRLERPLERSVLDKTLDRAYPEFAEALQVIKDDPDLAAPVTTSRADDDKLNELLNLVRSLTTGQQRVLARLPDPQRKLTVKLSDQLVEELTRLSEPSAPSRNDVIRKALRITQDLETSRPKVRSTNDTIGEEEEQRQHLEEEYRRERDFNAWDAAGRPGEGDALDETDYSAGDE